MINTLFPFFLVLAFILPASISFAQDEQIDPKAYCLQNFPKDNGTGMDPEAYCACAAKELSGKMNQPKDSDEKGRKKAVANLKPCLDKHAKGPITNLCKTYNDQVSAMAKSGEKHPSLNCGCFYKKLVGNFTSAWSGQDGSDLSKADQVAVAQQTISECLK